MKRKFGFTLAEVLITLGIIGVVAALAAPALNSAVQKSKVGPSLRKFISTMEVANEHILADENADQLSAITTDGKELKLLSAYVQGSISDKEADEYSLYEYNGETYPVNSIPIFIFKNGDAIALSYGEPGTDIRENSSYKGDVAFVVYDINGFDTKPNKLGKDIFIFDMDDGGSIIPQGGKAEYSAYTIVTDEYAWKGSCDETTVDDGINCAGSIADNDWKVIYKY